MDADESCCGCTEVIHPFGGLANTGGALNFCVHLRLTVFFQAGLSSPPPGTRAENINWRTPRLVSMATATVDRCPAFLLYPGPVFRHGHALRLGGLALGQLDAQTQVVARVGIVQRLVAAGET